MDTTTPSPSKRARDFNMEHYRIRLTARLGIVLICLLLFVPRVPALIANPTIPPLSRILYFICLPFPFFMVLVIIFEYFLSKRLGPEIVKYVNMVDLILLAFFTADWVLFLIATLHRTQGTDPVCFKIGAVFGFISFSWRTLMVTLIVQKWQLKIIPPVAGLIVTAGYAIHYSPKTILFTLLSSGTQFIIVMIIMYCDDKVKWNMVWANIQKEKWMQVNNFILNSIPENIMILDLSGETKFISESFQSFIKNCHLSLDTKEFFKRIQGLQQQKCESNASNTIERLATVNELLGDHEDKDQVLEDIIRNFKESILKREISERQFQVYNGKLKFEREQERSIEVKISFVQHFENSYIIVILRDTTQRDLLVTLEETNKYKDQLLASVSHELRAPLNGNINLVESAVNSQKIPHSIKESLLIPALRSSKFLLHIINDILDMSQIKEQKLRLIFKSEDLKETIRSTAQLVELQAKKKGIELLLEIDPSLPTKFCTDHIRLSQIILNLLNNAVKFTKEGVVKLTAKPIIPGSSLVKISVKDSGIGMTQESLQKLFSSFTHIEFEGRQDLNPTGVGLGLNIAYNLALLLGPKNQQGINVTSLPGHGSTFTLLLENKGSIELSSPDQSCDLSGNIADELGEPVKLMSFPQMQKISSGTSNSIAPIIDRFDSSIVFNHTCNSHSCTCPKILVVDDNPFNTMACETILDSMDIKCDCVFSGSSCVKNLLKRQDKVCGESCKQYSVIFMDQEMPEMSGVETVNEIKRLQEENLISQDIKIVGCTAHKSTEEVNKFLNAGIEQWIHKPISPEMLKEILKETTILEK